MARRRVNTPLITTLGLSALLVGGTGYFFYKHRGPRNPAPYIVAGDEAMKQQDYPRAAVNYVIASEIMPQDVSLHIKLGKAYLKGQRLGGDELSNAVKEFTSAEELDPASKDAWSGLYDTSELRVEQWEARSNQLLDKEQLPIAINTACEAAAHLKKLEPDNLEARAAGPIFTIRTWLLNLTMPETDADLNAVQNPDKGTPEPRQADNPAPPRTPEAQVEDAITDLTKLMRDHPENERIPYWIARARAHQGQLALSSDTPGDAPAMFADAAGEFDGSIQAKPDVIGLYLFKAEILRQLMSTDPSPDASVEYRAKLRDALDNAQKIADPKNASQYLMAKQQWAQVLSAYDPYDAELVYKDVISKFPDEIGVRVQLAKLLQHDATRRKDALAVLDAIPTLPGASVTNPVQRENWELNVANSKLVRADIQTDLLQVTPPGKARDNLVADIHASLDAASKLFADTPPLLRVRGRFELANGQVVEAIATLTLAVEKMSVTGQVDYDLLRTEANAYRAGGQTGKAIELLERAMTDPVIANNAEIHTTLAELHLNNKDIAGSRQYIDWLAVRYPDRPHVIELEIAALGPNADPKVAKDLFDKLPEKTAEDISSKELTARELGFKDEDLRLLLIMNKANPGYVQVVFAAVPLLKEAGRKDEALAIIASCKALHPDDSSLDVLREAINGDSRDVINGDTERTLKDIKDPFEREMKLAQLYESEQRPDDQMAELLAALAVQPDNIGLLQEIFLLHIGAGRFEQAKQMLPHLIDLNADDAHGLMLTCKLCLAQQDVQGALAASRQMTKDFGTLSGSWELYGESLEASGQLDLACQQFIAALALQPTNLDASRNLISCSVNQGKLADAQAYIKQARTRFPDDLEYLEMNVQFEINWGNPESVLEELNRAIHNHPSDRRIYAMTADALLASMRARAAKGDASGASDYLAKALELFQTASTNWPDDLRFANGLAQMQLGNKDLPGAEQTLISISQRPRWKGASTPLILLARVYLQAGKLDLAESALKQALDADPKSLDGHLVLADCKILQQKYDDALLALQPVLDSYPAREKYTDLQLGLNKGAMAENELNDAIKADPTNIALINLRLHVYDAEGLFDKGLRAANDALAADHTNVMAYFWKGKFEASGTSPDYDLALTDLGLFRDSRPRDVRGRVLIAQLLDLKGDRDGAIHELEAALSFAPQDRAVRVALVRDYLTAVPPHTMEASRLLTQTLALPAFAHDPEFECKAALVWAQEGETDKAMTSIRDVIENVKDKGPYISDYFSVLLLTKSYKLLLDESTQYTGAPNTSWFVFNDRAIAEAATGDSSGATTDFQTALDRSGIERTQGPASVIVHSITQAMNNPPPGKSGVQSALDMVLPRAQNSVAWKLLAVDLYVDQNNLVDALKLMETALPSLDSLPLPDRIHLLQVAAGLYYRATPPQTDKCVAMYQKLLAINPNDVDSMNDMACVLSDLDNKPEEALVWSQKAFDITEQSGHINNRIYDTQGWILIQLNRAPDGVEILHKAIDQSDFPEAHYHLARGYLKMQLPEEAQRQLGNASKLIEDLISKNAPVDLTLKPKIEAASKEADQMIKDKTQVKADQ